MFTFKKQRTKIHNAYFPPITDWEDSILFYIAHAHLTLFSLIDSWSMCIPLTPLLFTIITVIFEVYLQCFTESVSLRVLGNSTSRAEISSPNSLYFKALQWAQLGCLRSVVYLTRIYVNIFSIVYTYFLSLQNILNCPRFSSRNSFFVMRKRQGLNTSKQSSTKQT